MTGLAWAAATLGLVAGLAGYAIRHAKPRAAMFLMGVPAALLGLWMLASTLGLLDARGPAPAVDPRAAVIPPDVAPAAFHLSFWFHLGVGTLVLALGVLALVLPFTRRWGPRIRFPAPRRADA